MPDRAPTLPAGRIAVVDVGSNSLRLVVFERLGEALMPLLNEKVMCGLARGIARSGRLNRDGVQLAYANVQRFVALARALQVDHLAVIATAAVRDAKDGAGFAAELERRNGIEVRVIDGTEEARLSALGVLAGIPNADGVAADLGGGSVELVEIGGGDGRPAIGSGVTLPLGPLRLGELGDSRKAIVETIDRTIAEAPVLRAVAGRSLYLVGGAWRAIARLHMEQVHYPLHIIHQYAIGRSQADGFLELVARLSRRSLEQITTINRKRLEVVPLAATILRRLIAVGRPERVVFSAFGLREGYAYGLLPSEHPVDPLIAACSGMAEGRGRFHTDGDRLQLWIAPLFPGLPAGSRRLHRAVCWLSDLGWMEHPDYRAEHAFTRSLRMPVGAIDHAERVFIAAALHTRYGGAADDTVRLATAPLLNASMAAESRALGLALRLAYTLCGGALDLLAEVRLVREADSLILELPEAGGLLLGEAVERRLAALGRALNLGQRSVRYRAAALAS
ncbi:MAG TPA: Ppx/GppA family phosphatase [Stellaceae bacterium]|jgi:exopolyphosphatase/guanosine-5'-triphosphate,3'-diphosphate pyrophosphatase